MSDLDNLHNSTPITNTSTIKYEKLLLFILLFILIIFFVSSLQLVVAHNMVECQRFRLPQQYCLTRPNRCQPKVDCTELSKSTKAVLLTLKVVHNSPNTRILTVWDKQHRVRTVLNRCISKPHPRIHRRVHNHHQTCTKAYRHSTGW